MEHNAELLTEIERLQNAYKQCAWERDTFLEELKTAKSEAIKELAERFRKEVAHIPAWGAVAEKKIDTLLKEMESK